MNSFSRASKILPRQWLQSSLLHGALLLCVVLYHLHSQGSLSVSAKSFDQIATHATTISSQPGIDYLELSFEQDAMTEPQPDHAKPEDVLIEVPPEVARETLKKAPVGIPIEVSKEVPATAVKHLRSAATKATATEGSPANIIPPASATYRVAAKPLQTARPDHAYSPKPAYPIALRDLGVSGVVWLRVWVDDVGRPREIELSKGSGYRLFDEAALRAVQHWRFIPAKNGQQNLASWVEFAVRFEING
jgi:protein TonB